MDFSGHIEKMDLSLLGTSLSCFRLVSDSQVQEVKNSMVNLGMLQPILVRHISGTYQIVDGFKRYYAAKELLYEHLYCRLIEVNPAESKALLICSNRKNSHTVDYEEGVVVYSLKTEDGLSGQEIANLLNQSCSWVSRRLSLIEKLAPQVQNQIKLGMISPSHAREIIKLPRGNQETLTHSILDNKLTSRESRLIVESFLKSKNKEEQSFILSSPHKVIANLSAKEPFAYDCRLSKHGNKVHRTSDILHRQLHILQSQLSAAEAKKLLQSDKPILHPKLDQLLRLGPQILSSLKNYLQK